MAETPRGHRRGRRRERVGPVLATRLGQRRRVAREFRARVLQRQDGPVEALRPSHAGHDRGGSAVGDGRRERGRAG